MMAEYGLTIMPVVNDLLSTLVLQYREQQYQQKNQPSDMQDKGT